MIHIRVHVWSTPNSGYIVHVVVDGAGRGPIPVREILFLAAEEDQR